jgi:hypothetical protein
MKTKLLLLVALLGLSVFALSCEDQTDCIFCSEDNGAPSVPKGLYSVTGDEAVYLFWYPNDESDLEGYKVYRNTSSSGYFGLIGTTTSASFVDRNVNNGTTYYYVVSAYDYYGNESGLSDVAYDTPRPEGYDWRIYDYNQYPNDAGFDFSTESVLPYDNHNADIYLDYDDYYGVFFLNVANDSTDIQDFGYTDNLDDANWAPEYGWSSVGWVEVISGHTYIIWTKDNHFAKLRVTSTSGDDYIYFDWAYQVDTGNPELKVRPQHSEVYLKRDLKETKTNSAI